MLLLGNSDPSKAVTWNTIKHLTFAVPFQDMKPNIYLGKVTTLLHAQKFILMCQYKDFVSLV